MPRSGSCSLRNGGQVKPPKVRTTTFGIGNISYPGERLWHKMATEFKKSWNLAHFKYQIKNGIEKKVAVTYVDPT